MLNLIFALLALGLVVAPFVAGIELVGWVVGAHAFPDSGTWLAAAIGSVVWAVVVARRKAGKPLLPRPTNGAVPQKRYVMRGYGGGKNTTHVHPRQQRAGKTIAYIPGVGFRHVRKRRRRS